MDVSYSPSWGSTQVEMLTEVTSDSRMGAWWGQGLKQARERHMGSCCAVPATTLILLPFGAVRNIHVTFVLPDLSSYTPKHSVKFSTWQEQKYEEIPTAEGPLAKEADSHGTQVMVRLEISRSWLCPAVLLFQCLGRSGQWMGRDVLPLNSCVCVCSPQRDHHMVPLADLPLPLCVKET